MSSSKFLQIVGNSLIGFGCSSIAIYRILRILNLRSRDFNSTEFENQLALISGGLTVLACKEICKLVLNE
jgi:hypothetical protein